MRRLKKGLSKRVDGLPNREVTLISERKIPSWSFAIDFWHLAFAATHAWSGSQTSFLSRILESVFVRQLQICMPGANVIYAFGIDPHMAYRLAWAQGTRSGSTNVRRKEVLHLLLAAVGQRHANREEGKCERNYLHIGRIDSMRKHHGRALVRFRSAPLLRVCSVKYKVGKSVAKRILYKIFVFVDLKIT